MKKLFTLALTLVMALGMVGCSSSSTTTETTTTETATTETATTETATTGGDVSGHLTFATITSGSSWYVYGATMAEVIGSEVPGLSFDVLPNSGSVGNLMLLDTGEADIGFGFNNINAWATQGILAFEEYGAVSSLRGLTASLDEMYIGIAIREDSGYSDLREAIETQQPIRLMTLNVGSGGEYGAQTVLAAYGVTYDDIISWGGSVEHTDLTTIVQAFKDGKADVFINSISQGHASFVELCISVDVQVAELDDAAMDYMISKGYSDATLPADSFEGQTEDVRCAGVTTCLIATEDLDEEIAYTITKTVYENSDRLAEGHASLANFDKDLAADEATMGVPLHEGAIRYYQEIGLID